MTTLEYILTAALVILIIFIFAQNLLLRAAGKQWANDEKNSGNRYYEVAVLYLNILSRELGNELMQRDPDFFKRNKRLMLQEWSQIEGDKKQLDALHTQLARKYPMFQDFDIVECWDYVLVGEALDGRENEELWNVYKEIKFFSEILIEKYEIYQTKLKDQGLDYFDEYLKRAAASKLISKLMQAEETYDALLENDVDFSDSDEIETDQYIFYRLTHEYYARLGIHLKDTNQYAIIDTYYDKDISKQYYETNYRFNELDRKSFPFNEDYFSSRKKL